jgi:hypothetical protein
MVASLYANPNWDDEKNNRSGRIKELNKHYNQTIERIYHPERFREIEIDWNNPFWQAHRRSIEKTRERYGLANHDLSMQNVIDAESEEAAKFKELERRAAMRSQVDQLSASMN